MSREVYPPGIVFQKVENPRRDSISKSYLEKSGS
jgi:hypothetical protein